MAKILNISNNIKINKDNLQPTYTMINKSAGSSAETTFTLSGTTRGTALILCDCNSTPNVGLVRISSSGISTTLVLGNSSTLAFAVDDTKKVLTVTTNKYSTVQLIDFLGNTWN